MIASRLRQNTGLPEGQIIYSDTSTWKPTEKPLSESAVGLSGKPDYLIQQGNTTIPVEIKSTKVGQNPYESHIYQLAAYCRLVENKYKSRPSHGILHYPNKTFRIDYSSNLESQLFITIEKMRSLSKSKEINRSHNSSHRCTKCGYHSICDQIIS